MRVSFFKSSQPLYSRHFSRPYSLKNQQFASPKKDATGRRSILSFLKNGVPFSGSKTSFFFQGSTPGDPSRDHFILELEVKGHVFHHQTGHFWFIHGFFRVGNPTSGQNRLGDFLPTEVVDEPSYASARLVDDEGSSLTTWAANCRTGFRSIQAENTDCNLAFRDIHLDLHPTPHEDVKIPVTNEGL